MAKEGRPLKFETPEQLSIAIQDYFDKQSDKKEPVTITGLAYALGFDSRQSIYDYKEREEFSYILKRATFFVESCYEQKLSGQMPTGAIFALKNMGWRDKVETGLTDKDGNDVPITGMVIK
jgi:DNA-packaging protein gp3